MNPHAYLICVQGTTKLGYNFNANLITVTDKSGTKLAEHFAEEVKNAMENIITLDSISRCSLEGDYNYTDTRTKQYRYQAVFDISHY